MQHVTASQLASAHIVRSANHDAAVADFNFGLGIVQIGRIGAS